MRPLLPLALVVLVSLASWVPPSHAGVVDEVPPACRAGEGLDVLFLVDLSVSLYWDLPEIRETIKAVTNDLDAQVDDLRVGVASHIDYPGTYSYPGYSNTYGAADAFPWRLDQDLTTDLAAAKTAAGALQTTLSGGDLAESYSRALYESVESVSWGEGRHKVVVMFADAFPHDLDWNGQNLGGDPGRDALAQTPDDLDFETVAKLVADSGITVFGMDASHYSDTSAVAMYDALIPPTGGWHWHFEPFTARGILSNALFDDYERDAAAPTVSFAEPLADAPRLYVDGVDAGPSPLPVPAVAGGVLPLRALAQDDCILARASFSGPDISVAVDPEDPRTTRTVTEAAPGRHHLFANVEDWVGRTAEASVEVALLDATAMATAVGSRASANVPLTLDARSAGAAASGPTGFRASHHGEREFAPGVLDARYRSLDEAARTTREGDVVDAHAMAEIAQIDLLGGRIQAEAVRAVSRATFDLAATSGALDAAGSAFTGLVIDGAPVEVTAPGQEVALPGVGFVRLFEVLDASRPGAAIQQVNMIHVFLDSPSLKGEVLLGTARAAAGWLDPADGAPAHTMDAANDAGAGEDVASAPEEARAVSSGVYAGQLGAGDAADAYAFEAAQGDRIRLRAQTAGWQEVVLAREPSGSDLGVGTRGRNAWFATLTLYDPDLVPRARVESTTTPSVDLRADKAGAWTAVLEMAEYAPRHHYSLALAVAPDTAPE